MRVLLNGSSHEVSSAPPVTVKKLLAELGLVGPVAVEINREIVQTLLEDAGLAVDAAEVMEQHRVTSVLAVDGQGRLVGALNTNDLMRAKVI